MSAYADRFKMREQQLPLLVKALDFMVDVCPAVRDVLLGVYDDNGQELVKGAGITIWCEGNRLKFVVNVKSNKEKGWGIISDPRHLWESLEKALVDGEIEWKAGAESPGEIAY